MRRPIQSVGSWVLFSFLLAPLAAAADDPAGIEFFEKHIRPVLAEHCYKCHGANAKQREAGLRLDVREASRRGGESGPAVVPGDPEKSLLIASIRYGDASLEMPPDGRISKKIVANFEKWIAMGAPDPRDDPAAADGQASGAADATETRLWSFQTPRWRAAPKVENQEWPRTSIDRFVLHRLEERPLEPVRDASRRALVRRLYFDLTGLPPSPQELERFLGNRTVTAWEDLVDRLLASPRFGERWGRHWMDVVRFAESSGQEFNFSYPHAWPYRDYVIDSFNGDRPYDEFVCQQLAGDLMPRQGDPRDDPQQIATAFLAFGPKRHNSSGTQFRMDIVDDQIDVTCRALLGLTVACARCHDHKFDPIPTRDYYSLAGVFMSTEPLYGTIKQKYSNNPTPVVPIGPEGLQRHQAVEDHRKKVDGLAKQVTEAEGALKKFNTAVDEAKKLAEAGSSNASVEGNGASKQEAIATKRSDATGAEQTRSVASVETEKKTADRESLEKQLAQLRGELESFKKHAPPPPHYSVAARDREKPVDIPIAVRGNISNRGEIAPRGFLSELHVPNAPQVNPKQSGRMELARWITSRQNPLTARVMVNRIWYHLFGRGLVETLDNFGTLGRDPSHPELLDTLAVDFMRHGWSVKHAIRSIVLSRVYQLSTVSNSHHMEADPDNVLLWRMRPRRLEAEAIRDAMLVTSGQLDLTRPIGSPVTALGDRLVRDVALEKLQPPSRHRSVYLPVIRDYLPELFQVFDFADPSLVVGRRAVTTVPSQALFLRNSQFAIQQARKMALRLLARAEFDDTDRIDWAYQLAVSRHASAGERDEAASAIEHLVELAEQHAPVGDAKANQQAGDGQAANPPREIAWTAFCQALMGSAEFRYLVE
ncbi:MAG: PSD1 and planctomycete cytochrome C domain-containing protein [Pirellulales bacterium]